MFSPEYIYIYIVRKYKYSYTEIIIFFLYFQQMNQHTFDMINFKQMDNN